MQSPDNELRQILCLRVSQPLLNHSFLNLIRDSIDQFQVLLFLFVLSATLLVFILIFLDHELIPEIIHYLPPASLKVAVELKLPLNSNDSNHELKHDQVKLVAVKFGLQKPYY